MNLCSYQSIVVVFKEEEEDGDGVFCFFGVGVGGWGGFEGGGESVRSCRRFIEGRIV